jgi:predicted Zn-dependent protease
MNTSSIQRLLPFWSRWALVLVVAASAISGCVTNPATGESEFSLISRAEEKQIGTEGDQQIVAEFGIYNDATIAAYVDSLGQAIAKQSDDPGVGWTFRVLDSPVVNAFALPGGFVYVTRGLLAHIEDEAQLAVVIGHEIGHVTARHTARRITQSQLVGLGVGIGSIAFPDVQPFLGAISQGLQLLFLKFSRDDESQADELGVKYATRTHYQASEGSEFFTVLKRITAQAELAGGGSLPEWASTHPDPARREARVLELAAQYKAEIAPNETLIGDNPAGYVYRLDNLVFGNDPRQGFVQGGVFYHPLLRFQFNVPSGWQVGNFPTQVQLAPPGENPDAAIIMTVAENVTPSAAASQFTSQQGVAVVTPAQALTVNGFSAVRVTTDITITDANGGTGVIRALSYFIQKGSNLFVFHGYSTQAGFAGYQNTFAGVFNSFAEVTNSAVINVKPFVVDVFNAPSTALFSALVGANANAGVSLEDLAIMNQVEQTSTIPAGYPLKRIQ